MFVLIWRNEMLGGKSIEIRLELKLKASLPKQNGKMPIFKIEIAISFRFCWLPE